MLSSWAVLILYTPTSNNMMLVHWPLMGGGAVIFGTARSSPLTALRSLAVPNVTANPSTASVPITVFLHKCPLLCGFKGLKALLKVRAILV